MSFEAIHKLLSRKPNKRSLLKNPFDAEREYLPIEYVQAKLDEIFPERDEEIISEQIIGNSINMTIRLTTPIGKRDGVGSSLVKINYSGLPIGVFLINARKIARSEALKNAAKAFGVAFGRDLNRGDNEAEKAYEQNVVND